MVNELAIQAATAAVVYGVLEGWRQFSVARAMNATHAAASAQTRSLGKNLGPRVEALEKAMARVEERLGMPGVVAQPVDDKTEAHNG